MGDVIRGKFPPRRVAKNTYIKRGDVFFEVEVRRVTGTSGECWKVVGALNMRWITGDHEWIFLLRKEEICGLRDLLTLRFISRRRLAEFLTTGRYTKLAAIMPLRQKVGMPGR
jgi:hypothetical protein